MVTDLPPLVDTHCHLGFGAFDEDREAVLTRASQAGVAAVVAVAVDAASAEQAAGLAAQANPLRVVPTAGLHPTEAACGDEGQLERVAELLADGAYVAVGETGLDDHHHSVPLERQVASLERHLALALDRDLPVILHCRDAFAPLREVLQRYAGAPLRGVLHCFTGSAEDAQVLVERGLHLGVGGITTFGSAGALRDALRPVPSDRLLLETDAPWLAPAPHRGQRNEPAYVAHVAAALAADRGEDEALLRRCTSAAADALFGLGLAPA